MKKLFIQTVVLTALMTAGTAMASTTSVQPMITVNNSQGSTTITVSSIQYLSNSTSAHINLTAGANKSIVTGVSPFGKPEITSYSISQITSNNKPINCSGMAFGTKFSYPMTTLNISSSGSCNATHTAN